MKIIEKWNSLTAKKKIIFIVLVLLVSAVVLYFSETDRGRLARAYWSKNPMLCNFIWEKDYRTRCTAVLTSDFNLCSKIEDDYYYPFCLFGVSIKREDPAACDEAKKLTVDRCITHIPEIPTKDLEIQKMGDREYQGYSYNETRYKEGCDLEGSIVRDSCMEYNAIEAPNFLLCDRISSDYQKDDCLQTLRGNTSYFCSYSPALCVAATYENCNGWGDLCFSALAYLKKDTSLCGNIASKELRDECFINDEIADLMRYEAS